MLKCLVQGPAGSKYALKVECAATTNLSALTLTAYRNLSCRETLVWSNTVASGKQTSERSMPAGGIPIVTIIPLCFLVLKNKQHCARIQLPPRLQRASGTDAPNLQSHPASPLTPSLLSLSLSLTQSLSYPILSRSNKGEARRAVGEL
jgi:hypothetical protein